MAISQNAVGVMSNDKMLAELNDTWAERDRFVAFAFCNADLLLELDSSNVVVYAAGASSAVLGGPAQHLVGQRFPETVAERYRLLVERLLRDAAAGRRIDNVTITIEGQNGATPPLILSGFHMRDGGGRTYLALRVARRPKSLEVDDLTRIDDSELYDRDSFADAALAAFRDASAAHQETELTFLELAQISELSARLDEAARADLVTTMGAYLRASSVNGDTAGQLDDTKFGLIHRKDLDVESLTKDIEHYARELDPAGAGVSVKSATMEVDSNSLTDADFARALVYTINQFSENVSDDFSLQNLSKNFASLTAATISQRNRFLDIIERRNFEIVFQPICRMETGRPHHFEALVRLEKAAVDSTPFEFVTFAEELDIICEFDLAMCAKVIERMRRATKQGYRYMIAVNLSGRSLSTPSFVERLSRLLEDNAELRSDVVFEVTESSKLKDLEQANHIIQELRSAGHIVCLDDFGAGVSAFQYLSALHVDVVKIDGVYVQEAASSKRGKALLKAMASMCRELGITTVAEMVENDGVARLVRECGIDYGQGYHFGRPSAAITEFQSPSPVEFNRRTNRG